MSKAQCNTQENRGRSARDRRTVRKSNAQIFSWMWARSSSPPSSFPPRPETSGARPLAPPSPPPVDLPPPTTILRFLAQEPSRHLLHLPQPPARLLPSRNRPTYAGHHWRRLELCSTVDPLLRSSSARTDHGNGFVVSHLCPLASFPLPWCAAGAGEPPSLPPSCLLPPVGWSAKVNRGRST